VKRKGGGKRQKGGQRQESSPPLLIRRLSPHLPKASTRRRAKGTKLKKNIKRSHEVQRRLGEGAAGSRSKSAGRAAVLRTGKGEGTVVGRKRRKDNLVGREGRTGAD